MFDVERHSTIEDTAGPQQISLVVRPPQPMMILADPPIGAVVAEVNRLHLQGGLQTARAIGQYLIDTCFGGDAARIHDKARHPHSFRELSQRDDLTVSATFLYYAVAVTEQMALLPADVVDTLSFTSQRALLAVPHVAEKTALARQSLQRGWTTRELQEVVKARAPSSNAGRPKTPDFVRALRLLDEAVALLGDEAAWPSEFHRFRYYESSQAVDAAAGQVAALTAKIERMRAALGGEVD
jgi:hypothetical protein